MSLPKVIAVDFDGCLCSNAYPEIGSPNYYAISALNRRKNEGAKIILWTCREGRLLEEAVEWCHAYGLTFDAVNEHLPENIEKYGNNTRKIYADEYWDDKAVPVKYLGKGV